MEIKKEIRWEVAETVDESKEEVAETMEKTKEEVLETVDKTKKEVADTVGETVHKNMGEIANKKLVKTVEETKEEKDGI